jgi:hypothetical protein
MFIVQKRAFKKRVERSGKTKKIDKLATNNFSSLPSSCHLKMLFRRIGSLSNVCPAFAFKRS